MPQLLANEFKDFFEKISLWKSQSDRIDSAVSSLSGFLVSEYSLKPTDVSVQGSFSTDTAISPAPSVDDGEYDVDIVAICVTEGTSPADALDNLEERINSNGIYKDKIEKDDPDIPCIRLRYADEENAKFHVDIVPAKQGEGSSIFVPRRDKGWEASDPKGFTEWVKEQGDRYRRTIMMLKRWRDENEVPIKSIVLQVLVAECISKNEDDATNIFETIKNMNSLLAKYQSTPEIHNPVLLEEVLTNSWTTEEFEDFKGKLVEAVGLLDKAMETEDHDAAALQWQEFFGEDFKFASSKTIVIRDVEAKLGDTSHAAPLEFPFSPAAGVTVEIAASFHKIWKKSGGYKKRDKNMVQAYSLNSGQSVPSNAKLDFNANVQGLDGASYNIYWQVVNTGEEASKVDGLRGNFFTSKNLDDIRYNSEQTSYKGVHWIECFVVLDRVCVARSGRFYVSIYHQFGSN